MVFPEHLQDLSEGNLLGVEDHLDGFGVTCASGTHFVVRGIIGIATLITDRRGVHPRCLPELTLRTPEATHSKKNHFEVCGKG